MFNIKIHSAMSECMVSKEHIQFLRKRISQFRDETQFLSCHTLFLIIACEMTR